MKPRMSPATEAQCHSTAGCGTCRPTEASENRVLPAQPGSRGRIPACCALSGKALHSPVTRGTRARNVPLRVRFSRRFCTLPSGFGHHRQPWRSRRARVCTCLARHRQETPSHAVKRQGQRPIRATKPGLHRIRHGPVADPTRTRRPPGMPCPDQDRHRH